MRNVFDMDWSFFQGKKILVTGHTGFKGTWVSRFLLELGADVTGYALDPAAEPSMFRICSLEKEMNSLVGDIRDFEKLESAVKRVQPEMILHMAAQPIVRESYKNPVYTYDVNVMGTVHIMECVRKNPCVQSFLNVTTDKVYLNREWEWGYRENEELNGFDPYSNSKSCSELVTAAYRNSFLGQAAGRITSVSTARAGNVIGGGDFAADRIIPDCVRAAGEGRAIEVRNPDSVRPYQHVLEPLAVYLMLLQKQWENPQIAGSYNVGPDEADCLDTGSMVSSFCEEWKRYTGDELSWVSCRKSGPHEANYLKLDCSKLKRTFGWRPCWDVNKAIRKSVEWYAEYLNGADMSAITQRQIKEFLEEHAGNISE